MQTETTTPKKAKPATAPKRAPARKSVAKPQALAAPTARMRKSAIEALEAAKRGKIPEKPDFSAETHKRFRAKLDEIEALVKAGDVKGLKAYAVQPVSSSRKVMDRYRNLAVIALEAQKAGGEIV